ncbi:endonuclease 8-like 3 isoform X2 [Silurus meridionalis]|uniref:endonuclease 8-like 3 isoform X2 n=1 Tax=Silurus meridionalis TaxID=175797 RepID=UPI001EEBC31E|nr:endonuclease 8-like 3 isoform X2 [Silurus meridionalis]
MRGFPPLGGLFELSSGFKHADFTLCLYQRHTRQEETGGDREGQREGERGRESKREKERKGEREREQEKEGDRLREKETEGERRRGKEMVEGPGCTLNGEKISSRVKKGQKVLQITGTGNHGAGAQGDVFGCFGGCEYTGVQTLGKELFLYFGGRALRLHFGMDGSMRINATEKRDSRGNPPSVIISLTEDTLMFFSTTAEIRFSEDCSKKVCLMARLDVCSPSFSVCAVVEAVCRESSRSVCDVLLDQSVLPGVGNIIKNEALFLTALNPAVRVNQLKVELVQHLVKMTREFSLLFYQCRKRGAALSKHCKVYKRSSCGQCRCAVTTCRLGSDNRMTYFCSRCQTEDPSEIDISKLPPLNTLPRWTSQKSVQDVDQVATKEEEEWSCDLCTLINRPIVKFCEACMSPRPPGHTDAAVKDPFFTALIRFPHNTFSKPQQEVKLQCRAAFGNTTLVLSDLSPAPSTPPSLTTNRRSSAGPGGDSNTAGIGTQPTGALISKRPSPGFPSIPSKRRKTESKHLTGGDRIQSASSDTTSLPTMPCCTTHLRPSVLRVVTKEGENKGRHFYTCALPQGAQCNFFQWADLHFPTCHHVKRTLMRTVLKLGPNNGRRFYVCPLKPGKQCEFFQWAE